MGGSGFLDDDSDIVMVPKTQRAYDDGHNNNTNEWLTFCQECGDEELSSAVAVT